MSIKYLVVHHTASGRDATVEEIRDWHVSGRGWRDIGYHWLVRQPEGTRRAVVHMGRKHNLDDVWEPWEYGAHVRGYNSESMGIALIGNFAEERMPRDMRARLVEHLAFLCVTLGLNPHEAIRGHREMPGASTACPGSFRLNKLRCDVAEKIG